MPEQLISLDQKLFLAINGAWNRFLDPVMHVFSAVKIWFPLYLLMAVLVFSPRCYGTRRGGYAIRRPIVAGKFYLAGIAAVAVCILGYLACDWGANLVKALVARPRPGYCPATSAGRFPDGCGTPYGFFSAHAANTFCFAILIGRILGRRWLQIVLLVWAALVSYSRIYLGFHFPLDVAVGIIWGICVAILLISLYKFAVDKIADRYPAL